MPAITVALTTLRKDPGFERLCDSLADQLDAVSIELVVVDGQLWYEPHRREKLTDAVRGRFPSRHVEPKPTVWQGPHRLTSCDHWAAASARNTAILHAQASRIAFVDDCQTVEPGWLTGHTDPAHAHITLAGGRLYSDNGLDHRLEAWQNKPPDSCPASWAHGMNISVPLEMALEVRGFDEKYDGQGGVEDCDFGIRLSRAGCLIYFHPHALVREHRATHYALHGWGAGPYPKCLTLSDGKPHYANEYLIEELYREPLRYLSAGTPDLRELRRLVQHEMPLPIPSSPTTDWRDGQPLREM